MKIEEIVELCRKTCESKKALGPRVLDVRKKTDVADFFLICSGTSEVHVQAIADGLQEVLKKNNVSIVGIEGYEHAQWVLLDVGCVIVHIFYDYVRDIYDLEGLWGHTNRE